MTKTDLSDPVSEGEAQKPKRRNSKSSADKWGHNVMELGFCILPSLLFRAQRRLGLSPTQLAVLLQLADFWWDAARKPYPKKSDLAERLSLSDRQVQRHKADLEAAGFVRRIARTASHRGKISNEYDLSGLVEKLQALEPEFRAVAEDTRARKKAVARPGFKPKLTAPEADATAS